MNIKKYLSLPLSSLCLTCCLITPAQVKAQRVLSLDSCRTLAKEYSRSLQQKNQDILAAEAQRKDVFTKFFPQVAARGLYLHMEKEFKLIDWSQPLGAFNFIIPNKLRDLGTVDLRNVWVGNVTAIQPLYMGGKIVSGYKMAGMAERLQHELKQTAATEVESKVDETYWQVVSLASKEKLIKQLLTLLKQTNKDVDAAIAAGMATKADGLTIRTKLSEAEVKLSQVENGLELSKMLLADLCGLGESNTFTLEDEGSMDIPLLNASNKQDEQSLAEAVERRSEIRSLRLVDSIYAKRVSMETASLSPKLYGFASYSMTNPNSFNGTKKTFGGPIRTTEDAHKAYASALKAVEMAKENMRYAEIGYKEGVIPLLNYTMAQTAWMSAQDNLIDTQIKVRLSESKLKNILAL